MIKNNFNIGEEGWCSYDYHASIVNDIRNIFILNTWEQKGGVNDSGYVWTDHRRWSTDVPENPISILPLIYYRRWDNKGPIDLREAEVSVYLRGDNLRLFGAECYFWVIGPTRWHFKSQPLEIAEGQWADEPNRFTLKNDESLWNMSWAGLPPKPHSLDESLGHVSSYGFSFVGFSMEVDGRLSMDEFEIRPAS